MMLQDTENAAELAGFGECFNDIISTFSTAKIIGKPRHYCTVESGNNGND